MSTTKEIADEWVTVPELVAEMKLKNRKALYRMFYRGAGPKRFMVGREIRMKRADIETWQASLQVDA